MLIKGSAPILRDSIISKLFEAVFMVQSCSSWHSQALSSFREDCLSTPGDVLRSNGLVRSQSYPLEGFYNALENCIVNITKTSSLIKTYVCRNAATQTGGKAECPSAFKDLINSHPSTSSSTLVDTPMEALRIEGGLVSQGAGMSHQAQHCLAARQCPLGSKVLACGRRREMEDTASVVPSFTALPCGMMGMCCCDREPAKPTTSDLHFFGIYDGHGGAQASAYCKERLHVLLSEELSMLDKVESSHEDLDLGWNNRWNKTLNDCFSKIDKEVGGVCPNGICDDETVEGGCACCEDAIAPENVGTTAVVAVVGSRQIVIANCGDSRAVLSRGGKAVPLSTDHKPEREDETSRIEAAGGRVICWDGYRVGGFLALSRAIGDRYLKRYVISEPEVTCIQREDEDEVLILASDGLWDVLSNDYACDIARRALVVARKKRENRTFSPGEDPAAASVAALLVKLAYSKGSKDNISVVVVDLKS
ncbi:hypothetical protein GOP47_0018095 [Adiantum capillus-veneris]|uniref:protein-serine/threonine phosphatase n=1 Tax=Adiantum capillus-veneris TaxID=13818 RepID=A0A9D4ZBA1_ADICA|nr:hypothetical protein GOP47_0018095 [Adiantum capillus-veneris]